MTSIVPSVLFAALPRHGVATLRFNFRGVGRSTGIHDYGDAERQDIAAAIDALEGITEGLPMYLCGWSFGADTSLGVDHKAICGWIGFAPPLRPEALQRSVAKGSPKPKWLYVPERDQFCPPAMATEVTRNWPNTSIKVAPGADHFFVGATGDLVDFALDLTAEPHSDASAE